MMEQKVVLITAEAGASARATRPALCRRGCKVVINYHRSQAQAEALAAEIGGWAVRQTWPIRSRWEEWLTMCWINIVNLTF